MNEAERWKRVILSLPDRVFFDLMRNYLGHIPTPFNKHSLIRRLVRFLRAKGTQTRIAALLDGRDRQIMTAVMVLTDPDFEELYRILEDDFSYLDLQRAVVNLERRLVLFSEREGETIRLRLNPLLEEEVTRRAFRLDALIPWRDVEIAHAERPWLNDSLLLAFLSFVLHNQVLIRKGGNFARRSEEAILKVFPALKAFEEGRSRLRILNESMLSAGLLQQRGSTLWPDLGAWRAVSRLDPADALLLLWSAGSQGASELGSEIEEGCSAVRKRACLLKAILASLPNRKALCKRSLKRLCTITAIRIAAVKNAGIKTAAVGSGVEPADSGGEGLPLAAEIEDLIGHLVRLGVFFPVHADEGDLFALNPHVSSLLSESQTEGGITVQPNFELILAPEVRLRQGLPIALSCQIERFDLVCSFSLTRRSIQTYLNMGHETESLVRALERFTGKPLPQNVLVTLRAWQQEFATLSLYEGIVLTVSEKNREILEQLLERYIRRRMGEGVYLLDPSEEAKWRRALVRAGFEYVPDIRRIGGTEDSRREESALLGAVEETAGRIDLFSTGEPSPMPDEQLVTEIREELLGALGETARRLPREQIEEIKRRIESRLILSKEQIQPVKIHRERTEAKGLDYLGKIRLIEQAIRESSSLQIIERTPSGRPRSLEIKPIHVETMQSQSQSGNQSNLIMVGRVVPTGQEMRIDISKMGLVRRIASSLLSGF
jgi:hypothetical protein